MDALKPLRQAFVRVILGRQVFEELPDLAAQALAAGVDSPSLRELALAQRSQARDTHDLFLAAMDELSIDAPQKPDLFAGLALEVASLRRAFASGEIAPDDVGLAFEGLTFSVPDLTRGDERRLASLVNEIELIRFTHLPEDLRPTIEEVLARAQEVFDELSSRSR